MMVRQNVAALSPQQVASLRAGVATMKARPDSDPVSWRFQANIHGTIDPVTSPLFNQCEHGTLKFLAWHRGYLYYFERILRQASGDPNLTLPYWDWSTSPALPDPYRVPADAGNSLYDDSRSINDGSALPSSVVVDDLNTALAYIPFPPSGWPGFSPSLEGSPHGSVHVLIGGRMGSVATAANDPIFWLHHGNIERIWNRWLNLNSGRVDPSDSVYLDTKYSFVDESGQTVTHTIRELSDSQKLGYCYDDTRNPPAVDAAAIPMPQMAMQHQMLRAASTHDGEAATEKRPLGLKTETIRLQSGPQHAAALKAATSGRPGSVVLQIEGLSTAEAPNFTYSAYLNLPAEEADPARMKTHYVGTLNLFGKDAGRGNAGHEHGAHASIDAFDVTEVVARLKKSNRWNPDSLSVTLKPLTPIPPKGGEQALQKRTEISAEKARISYQRISLMITP
jgi:tyrosinase